TKSENKPNRLSVAKKRPPPELGWRMVNVKRPHPWDGVADFIEEFNEPRRWAGAQRVNTRCCWGRRPTGAGGGVGAPNSRSKKFGPDEPPLLAANTPFGSVVAGRE